MGTSTTQAHNGAFRRHSRNNCGPGQKRPSRRHYRLPSLRPIHRTLADSRSPNRVSARPPRRSTPPLTPTLASLGSSVSRVSARPSRRSTPFSHGHFFNQSSKQGRDQLERVLDLSLPLLLSPIFRAQQVGSDKSRTHSSWSLPRTSKTVGARSPLPLRWRRWVLIVRQGKRKALTPLPSSPYPYVGVDGSAVSIARDTPTFPGSSMYLRTETKMEIVRDDPISGGRIG